MFKAHEISKLSYESIFTQDFILQTFIFEFMHSLSFYIISNVFLMFFFVVMATKDFFALASKQVRGSGWS